LEKRKDSRKTYEGSDTWYSLTRFGQLTIFQSSEKIVFPGEQKHLKFGFDISQSGYSGARVFGITIEDKSLALKFLLAILNSSLMEFYIHSSFPLRQGGYFSMSSNLVEKLPCCLPVSQKPFINLVEKILDAKKIDPTSSTGKWEKQIDNMVYHLYNLTYEEAKIIDPELSEEEFLKFKL